MALDIQALGMIEFNSIAAGIEASDVMLKSAGVQPLILKTICPGKYLASVYSDVSSVEASIKAGLDLASDAVVDHFIIPNISPVVISAMTSSVDLVAGSAVGIIETFAAASAFIAADIAVKASNVDLIEVRMAMGLGGKGLAILSGDVASVETAVVSGSSQAAISGLLVRKTVIPNISPQLLDSLL